MLATSRLTGRCTSIQRSIASSILILNLVGCAPAPLWTKDGATQAHFDRDKAQCEYEAALATASYSQGQTARTAAGAAGQGFGEGIAIGLKKTELGRMCMAAKGYSQVPRP